MLGGLLSRTTLKSLDIGFAPSTALGMSVAVLLFSLVRAPGPPLNSKLQIDRLFELFCLLPLSVAAIVLFRTGSQAARTFGWVFGVVGFVFLVSLNMISTLRLASFVGTSGAELRDLVAICLASLVWVIGVSWTVQVIAMSVVEGDWSQTVWTRLRKK